jgi:hypothetical protein
MLNSISWGQYISAIVVALVCYYVCVGYMFFRWELLALIGIKKVESGIRAIPTAEIKKHFTAGNHTDYLPKENAITGQPFLDELAAYLGAMNNTAPAEEVLFAANSIASKYPMLTNSQNKTEINQAANWLLQQYFPNKFMAEDIQDIIK